MDTLTDRNQMSERSKNSNRREARRTLSAGTLIGDKVTNRQNEELGNLKEMMIDVDTGRVAYGVLESGSFLGMGGKLFAIPWQAFDVDEADQKLLLDVPKERIKEAEGFDKDHWPDVTDPDFGLRTHRHYGYEPYWNEA